MIWSPMYLVLPWVVTRKTGEIVGISKGECKYHIQHACKLKMYT